MRRRPSITIAGALCALAMVAACKREPSFDERYANADKAIREQADELEKDMAQRAAAAGQVAPKSEPEPEPEASGASAPGGKI